jgi:CheY-like chemotaxis protein
VLVVDDVAVNRELVNAMLSPFELEIVEAVSGEDALSILENQAFDLILMDVQMPGMSGMEATRQIRAGGHAAGCPIVAMTANHLPEQVAACLDAGMTAHVAKPFVLTDLLATIFQWIGGSHGLVVLEESEQRRA